MLNNLEKEDNSDERFKTVRDNPTEHYTKMKKEFTLRISFTIRNRNFETILQDHYESLLGGHRGEN